MTAWEEDSDLEKKFTERDLAILNKLADVLKIASKRTEVVSHVSDTLDHELIDLSTFLDSAAERRPKGKWVVTITVVTITVVAIDSWDSVWVSHSQTLSSWTLR